MKKIRIFVPKKALSCASCAKLLCVKKGFSLIEIMLGLIVVSVMVAAFAPVITKKVSSSAITLSSALGLGIDSKLFLYSENKNKIDGCKLSNDKTYLECPFIVPKGVSVINAVIVSAGGGGAGGVSNLDNMTFSSAGGYAKFNGNNYLTITKNMKNFKIKTIVSPGGGGGGGTYGVGADEEVTIKPKSQSDCNKIAPELYYTGYNSCITAKNLSEKDINATFQTEIKSLKPATNYNSASHEFGNKICWSTGASNLYIGYKDHVFTNTFSTYQDYYKTNQVAMPDYPVCTYPSAELICQKFGYGTIYDSKWRLPNEIEAKYIADNHPISIGAFTRVGGDKNDNNATGKICDPGYSVDSIQVEQRGYRNRGTCNAGNIDWPDSVRYKNPCLPEYVWGQNGDYYLLKQKPSEYLYITSGKCNSYTRYITYIFSVKAVFGNCRYPNGYEYTVGIGGTNNFETYIAPYNGCLRLINREYSPFSVRCVIDWMGTENKKGEVYQGVGGGGGSGAMIADMEIPNKLIEENIGGKIVAYAGTGGDGGAKGSNGLTGGNSYVQIYNATGALKAEIKINGGTYGRGATSSGNGSGGSTPGVFYYKDGNSEYKSKSQADSLTISGTVISKYTFKKGNNASSGSYGGAGGASVAPSNIGNKGGGGYGGSASGSGSDGQNGYVELSYQNVYKGASGGGGAGGQFARIESIPVEEDAIVIIKIGKGGTGGNSGVDGEDGGISSIKIGSIEIKLPGGKGGAIGEGADSDNPDFIPKQGNGGVETIYTINSLFNAVINKKGLGGWNGSILKDDSNNEIGTQGGIGGFSGIGNYFVSDLNTNPKNLSIGCGGYSKLIDYGCNLFDLINGAFSGSIFENPGKVYKVNNTEYGSAGAGGGGGGVNYSTGEAGKGSDGQHGYVYLWWEEE